MPGGSSHQRAVEKAAKQRLAGAAIKPTKQQDVVVQPPSELPTDKAMSSKLRKPLERSTVEFYLALAVAIISTVFPMNWALRAFLILILIGITCDLILRSRLTLRWHVLLKGMLMICCTALISWRGWLTVKEQYEQEHIPYAAVTNYGEGTVKDFKKGCFMQINTNRLVPFADKYKLVIICGLDDASHNQMADTNIAVSDTFDVTGQLMDIRAPWPSAILLEQSFCSQRWHTPVLVPKGVIRSEIKSLNDVKRLGGLPINGDYLAYASYTYWAGCPGRE